MKVVVIKPHLKYRFKHLNKGRSFTPEVGDVIDLPLESAEKELESSNVRKLLPEEYSEIPEESENTKTIKKKKKKIKKKSKEQSD